MKSFQQRRARVTVEVQRPDPDGQARALRYVFEDHRMTIQVVQGGRQMGNAKVQIFGVPLDSMNQIARLWLEVLTPSGTDTLTIEVEDEGTFTPFFSGMITWTAVNAGAIPSVSLDIEANDAGALMVTPQPPYADAGPVALDDALRAILGPSGFELEYAETAPTYNLVRVRAEGTALEQVSTLMTAVPELAWFVSLQRVVVRPVGGPLGGDPVRVDKSSGLIGYPVYSTSGLSLATVFDRQLRPGVALDVAVPDFDYVNRTKWVAAVLQHSLQPNTPRGAWTTDIAARAYGSKANQDGSTT